MLYLFVTFALGCVMFVALALIKTPPGLVVVLMLAFLAVRLLRWKPILSTSAADVNINMRISVDAPGAGLSIRDRLN
jgi:hypothetical protein